MSPGVSLDVARCVALAVAFLCPACAGDLNERIVPCRTGSVVESAHAWGRTIALRPAAGHEWSDLLREQFRRYGLPPVSPADLRRTYGAPMRTWVVEGRPFLEYSRPEGELQLGLEEERSGSALHRSWRLRLEPRDASLPTILENSAFNCLSELLRDDVEVVLLSRGSGIRKASLTVHEGQVQEVVWPNLERP
jgi:hypothetical protein